LNSTEQNARPRKVLGFQTPKEALSNLTLKELIGVALQA
jgi:IS30 family transposase